MFLVFSFSSVLPVFSSLDEKPPILYSILRRRIQNWGLLVWVEKRPFPSTADLSSLGVFPAFPFLGVLPGVSDRLYFNQYVKNVLDMLPPQPSRILP